MKIILWLFIFLMIPFILVSQITSPEAIFTESTNYPSGAGNDTVFYYSNINGASLNVTPGGQGSYTFNWYRYNTANNSFDIHISTQTGTSSSISGLMETGYRVTVDDGNGTVLTYTCWTLQPEIISAEIEMVSEDCFELQLSVEDTVKTLVYHDPANGAAVPVDYGLTYTWSSIPESPVSDETTPDITIDAPVEDTEFTVSVGSRFGISETATLHNQALAVKAAFTQEPENRGIENEMDTTQQHSAPLVVRFYSEETKGNNIAYEWTFGDDGRAYDPNPLHTFQYRLEYC